jgi:isopentenyl phosphate kinase
MDDVYLVKLGGAAITDTSKPGVAKIEEIKRLLSEINDAMKAKHFRIIIGHGGGSFPHVPAKLYRVNEGLINSESRKGAALVKLSARELNSIVVSVALELGMDVFPFDPSSFIAARSSRGEDVYTESIKEALEHLFVPIVYGDVVIDKEKGVSILSTEEVFRSVSKYLPVKKVFLASDVDGVFDKDPFKYNDAKLLPIVTSENINEVMGLAGDAHKVDVTGGMGTKVMLLSEIVRSTSGEGFIFNGNKPGNLYKVLVGESISCTKFLP